MQFDRHETIGRIHEANWAWRQHEIQQQRREFAGSDKFGDRLPAVRGVLFHCEEVPFGGFGERLNALDCVPELPGLRASELAD
jgi:hypothetical protein